MCWALKSIQIVLFRFGAKVLHRKFNIENSNGVFVWWKCIVRWFRIVKKKNAEQKRKSYTNLYFLWIFTENHTKKEQWRNKHSSKQKIFVAQVQNERIE